ncbi:topoisomerase DNA-binding C4 zinc finger domain-containing protein [Pseudomonas sp. JG-B]|uniref:topoisomerase DNA-binding C4 zinc finger domain-containing protein n=1 Tax=Pseudomonas sp. JG-B TaxID=2603214 RepID=UPI0035562E08
MRTAHFGAALVIRTAVRSRLKTKGGKPLIITEVFNCPECTKPLRRIRGGANGPFWGCTGHPGCKVTLPDQGGKPGQRKAAQLSNYPCGKCGAALVFKQKKGKGGYAFWGCSQFSKGCRTTYPDKAGKPVLSTAK